MVNKYNCLRCGLVKNLDTPVKTCPKCGARRPTWLDEKTRENINNVEGMQEKKRRKHYPTHTATAPTREQKLILQDKKLLEKITKAACELMGGQDIALRTTIILCCVVFIIDKRLNILLSASPSHQKSHMAKVIRLLFPDNIVVYYVNMSPKLLQYLHANDRDWTWNNKILFVEDATQDFLDSDVVKVFMTEEGKAGTVKDGVAAELEVIGRPSVLTTTAKSEVTPEFSHRNVIVPFEEGTAQRRKAGENMVTGNTKITPPYNDIMSKLKTKKINIPFKRKLPKFFPFGNKRAIRDFKYFLIMIECSAVLHQYNRKEKNNKIIAEQQDYEIAKETLNTLGDEGIMGLTNTQRKLYVQLIALSKDDTLTDTCDGFTVQTLMTTIGGRARKNWYEILDAMIEANSVQVTYKATTWEDKDGNLRKSTKEVAFYKAIEKTDRYNLPKWEVLSK